MNTQNNQHKQTIPFPDEIIHLETCLLYTSCPSFLRSNGNNGDK